MLGVLRIPRILRPAPILSKSVDVILVVGSKERVCCRLGLERSRLLIIIEDPLPRGLEETVICFICHGTWSGGLLTPCNESLAGHFNFKHVETERFQVLPDSS